MKEIDRKIIGTGTGKETFSYTWRDLALYAVGVGAKANELEYQYEKQIKALPTYGVVPYWGTFGITPFRAMPSNACFSLDLDRANSLHMAHKLILHKPLDPKGATFTIEDTITEIFDRGGKSAVIRSELVGYDAAGEKVFTNVGDSMFGAYTASGSPAYPQSPAIVPERAPDFTLTDRMAENQHLLYRLSGDTNTVHSDPDFAASIGFKGPIMQGLCAYGYVCRLAVKALFPGQPERVRSIEAQMRGLVYPGTDITLQLWKTQEGQAVFRMLNSGDSKAILDKGLLTWE